VKKAVSILLVLIMALSVVRLSIATHYCGDKVADTRVSLSGKLASCGMEDTEKNYPMPIDRFTTHCCDDQLITIGIINIFITSISFVKENSHSVCQVLFVPVNQSFHLTTTVNNLYSTFNPPGGFLTHSVSLNDICVFRI
jgi:hypothetical protein